MKILTILETKSKGRIHFTNNGSKFIEVQIALDDYGFTTKILKSDLKELIKPKKKTK